MKIEFNGRSCEGKYFMVAVANGKRYGGGFKISPLSSIHDGELNLLLIHPLGVLKRLRYLPAVEKGKHLLLPFVEHLLIKKLRVSSNENLTAHLDGEVLESKQFEIEVMEGHFQFRH